MLYLICAPLLIRKLKRNDLTTWWPLAYITAMFVFNTIANGTNLKFNEMVFIDDRNGPGGPLYFLETDFNNPIQVASFSCSFINQWFQDGLLVS
jgi:hypothetical protein